MSELRERIKEPTPDFFKKLGRWALLVACIAAGATPVLNAVGLPVIATIVGAVGVGASGVAATSGLTSKNR